MNFQDFEKAFLQINSHATQGLAESFAIDEFRRFISIGGTILTSFPNVSNSTDERRMTHILIRSLLENFFWIIYVFDGNDKSSWNARFYEYLDGFKKEYAKLYNDPNLPHKTELEPAQQSWVNLKKPMDINSVLAQVKNSHGTRLDFLYFLYRITSFDTHGKTMESIFSAAFAKQCNFPYVKIDVAIDLMADEYLSVWKKL
jgi:hypothetical protein